MWVKLQHSIMQVVKTRRTKYILKFTSTNVNKCFFRGIVWSFCFGNHVTVFLEGPNLMTFILPRVSSLSTTANNYLVFTSSYRLPTSNQRRPSLSPRFWRYHWISPHSRTCASVIISKEVMSIARVNLNSKASFRTCSSIFLIILW